MAAILTERCDYGQLSFLSLFLFTNVCHQATVNDEKRVVEDQRRALDEEIADFQRRKVILIFNVNIFINTKILFHSKAQYESDKMSSGHHTLTLGKLGKKK